MKKFVALLLALAMVFALCACGNSNSAAPKQDDAAESSQPSDNASENQSAADLFRSQGRLYLPARRELHL